MDIPDNKTKRQLMTEDYLSGMSMPEVAAKYGRTVGGLQTSFYQWGVKLSPDERRKRREECCRRTLKPMAGRPAVWPDCPPEKKRDYDTLAIYFGAREARKMLEAV